MDQPRSLDSLVYVAQSPIHGLGLFARVPLERGSYIGRYEGRPAQEDAAHVLWVQADGDWEGVHGENALKYLNHSRTPNAEFDGVELYALRDILPGEEITFHYGEEWNEIG